MSALTRVLLASLLLCAPLGCSTEVVELSLGQNLDEADAGPPDSEPADTGPSDQGSDAGVSDADPTDAEPPDQGPPDTGPSCVCALPCRLDSECMASDPTSICSAGLCTNPSGDCASDADCARGERCVDPGTSGLCM